MQQQVLIENGNKVTLHFSIQLEDGTLIDTTQEKKAAVFIVGDGQFLPGFEKVLLGLEKGVKKSFRLEINQAFGEHQEEYVKTLPRTDFSKDMELSEGLVIAFSHADGSQLPGVVKNISNQMVRVDFNHPLAGRVIIFKVEILDIKEVS